MSNLKSVEAGMLIFLAESLSAGDTSAALVLSSMASIAATQNALLRVSASLNTSTASFETPLSPTWAYNIALNSVQPGSCSIDLPIPVLPALFVSAGISGNTQSNSSITFGWDAAGRAAASRSGKPLYIGWVNQVNEPKYTLISALGDGYGLSDVPAGLAGTAVAVLTAQPSLRSITELTEATLAGPVVVSL